MSYGITDYFAGRLSPNRDTYRRFTCTFCPQNGGYRDQCMNAAQFVVVAWRDETGRERYGEYPTLRCAKHRAVDERTARNRGWGEREYVTFDAPAEAKARDLMVAQNREADRLAKIQDDICDHVAFVLEHADLTDGQAETLRVIAFEANERTLTVR